MNDQTPAARLIALAEEAGLASSSSELMSVARRALTLMGRVGSGDIWVTALSATRFPDDAGAYLDRFYRPSLDRARKEVAQILEDAAGDLAEQTPSDALVELGAIDPGLWDHVRGLIDAAEWGKVATQAAVYAEATLRRFADAPNDSVGTHLMTLLFHPENGVLALGATRGEREGWHSLARGLVGALGNVDRHHIQERPDLRRYAIGVLFTASLLLTQVQYEHTHVGQTSG